MGDWQEKLRRGLDRISDAEGDWQGRPVPLEDLPVILHEYHPLREKYLRFSREIAEQPAPAGDGGTVKIINHWYDAGHNRDVYVVEEEGRRRAETDRRAPDRSMDRLKYWVRTIGAADAWTLDAEHKAREKLKGLLSDRQWRQYDLTGAFVESSPRSGLTYVFRRLRPTIAMTPRWRWGREVDSLRVLAVLCLHPVGYYAETWAGCMVPSDDVIAHVLMMRGDEAGYWKQANQHECSAPEAGL